MAQGAASAHPAAVAGVAREEQGVPPLAAPGVHRDAEQEALASEKHPDPSPEKLSLLSLSISPSPSPAPRGGAMLAGQGEALHRGDAQGDA